MVVFDNVIGAVAQPAGSAHVGVDHGHQLAYVSHIGGACTVGNVPHVFLTHQRHRVGLKDFRHAAVLHQGHISGDSLNRDAGAHGQCARFEGPVHLAVGIHDGVDGAAPNEGFHPYVGRHGANGFAALGDDGVDPHRVRVAEGLPIEVDGGQGQRCGVKGVDSQMGRSPGVGAPADELNLLGDGPVICAADT